MKDDKRALDMYAKIQAMVQKEARDIAKQVYKEEGTQYGVASVPFHIHNGADAPRVNTSNLEYGPRANGLVTMATNGTNYRLGLNFNAHAVQFYGIAYRDNGGIDKRAHVIGNAQLGDNYVFEAQSSTSVKTGGTRKSVIQGCSSITVDSSGSPPTVAVYASELNLIYVVQPGTGDPVAIGRVTDYGRSFVTVNVTLETDWEIVGTFVVT